MSRKIEITVETHRLTVVRRRREPARGWCRQCEKEVLMLPPDEAAGKAGVSVRTVNRWVEAETIHFNETNRGLLLICANSVGGFR
jgi:hypothetical protein